MIEVNILGTAGLEHVAKYQRLPLDALQALPLAEELVFCE